MIYHWESDEDRIKRLMKISPKKKLEWLNKMLLFISKTASKRQKALIRKLRETR